MIDEKLLILIQCPISGQKLTIAADELVATLNEKINGGSVRDRADQLVQQTLDQGLITEDGARLYPVRGGIPTLIADHAIELVTQSE
jgi:uncharacterized protein YbaR (Trm112 family)